MKIRIAFMGALGLAAGMVATPGFANGISIDENITCASVEVSTGSPAISLPGTAAKGNLAQSGVNFPVLVCADSQQGDLNLTSLPYQPKYSSVYTWVDLSAAGITAASLTGPATNPNTPPLSNFQGLNVAIIAQIEVLKLKGSYLGDFEIIFNFQNFPESACDNVFTPIAPSLTWYKKTYVFTGVGGVTACDSAATNDFLFGADGVLLGYNSAPEGSGFVLTPGLPPGWALQ